MFDLNNMPLKQINLTKEYKRVYLFKPLVLAFKSNISSS